MALAHLVIPGAMHTRFHHSMGAYHLMCWALSELQGERRIVGRGRSWPRKWPYYCDDIGHGPYSHALETDTLWRVYPTRRSGRG